MFKKSNNSADKTPKQENKDQVLKTAEAANQAAPNEKEQAAAAPANEDKKA